MTFCGIGGGVDARRFVRGKEVKMERGFEREKGRFGMCSGGNLDGWGGGRGVL